jgi:hypothetical protein
LRNGIFLEQSRFIHFRIPIRTVDIPIQTVICRWLPFWFQPQSQMKPDC